MCLSLCQVRPSVDSQLDLSLPPFLPAGLLVWSATTDPFCQCRPAAAHSQGMECSTAHSRAAAARSTDCWQISLFVSQMVSLANEVHSFHVERKKEVSSFAKSPVIGGLLQEPTLYDIFSYSYCYIGIMTGKWVGVLTPSCLCVTCLHFILSLLELTCLAWILTVVSLCLTLCHLSNIVWVHIVFSVIQAGFPRHDCFFVFLHPHPVQQHAPSLFFILCLELSHCSTFVNHCLINIPLSHPSISPKAHSIGSKHSLTGWGSRTHRSCPARCRVCSVWSWYPSTALCSWRSTLCFLCLMFALRSSWSRTSSSGTDVRMK